MIDIKAGSEFQPQKIEKPVHKAAYKNLGNAGFSIRKAAIASIGKRDRPSKPGSPPNTRGKSKNNLRSAIFVSQEPDLVIVGPRASVVGDSGEAHEFGKPRGGNRFPERPFMGPALEASLPRFAADWQGTIGE